MAIYIPLPPSLGAVIRVVAAALGLALVREGSGALHHLDVSAVATATIFAEFGLFWVTILAPGFYLCALWSLGAVFGRIAGGADFAPSVVKGLRSVGQNLVVGAACAVLLSPAASSWLGRPLPSLSAQEQISHVTIGLIGAVLFLLTRSGQRLRSELKSFV